MHDDAPEIRAALHCNPAELAAADLPAGNKSDSSKISRSTPQAASQFAASHEFDSGFVSYQDNSSSSPGPLRLSDSLSATSVLRI
ncbi:MAG: hypothetical protein AUH66_04910 [Acidobacteria bacterium 13_1_40CM_4_57_6]|nr:MAG: hypothetical protein AUH66_04910 [Acidobacteria bacterium 13_1_40CM_4_57_6]